MIVHILILIILDLLATHEINVDKLFIGLILRTLSYVLVVSHRIEFLEGLEGLDGLEGPEGLSGIENISGMY